MSLITYMRLLRISLVYEIGYQSPLQRDLICTQSLFDTHERPRGAYIGPFINPDNRQFRIDQSTCTFFLIVGQVAQHCLEHTE